MNRRVVYIAVAGLICAGLVGGGGYVIWHSRQKPATIKMVYDPRGYGGFVPVNRPTPKPVPAGVVAKVDSARDAYSAGRYQQSDDIATDIVKIEANKRTADGQRAVADARQLLAYSAARQHNLSLARIRFAMLQTTAESLPGGGQQSESFGDPSPSLVEEAAFQHAVCTSALGDKKGAELEFRQFMAQHPESPLLRAASDRIARMHGGDLPAVDLAVWQHAKQTAAKAQAQVARNEAMCGPACVLEVLRRRGIPAKLPKLATEMGTTERGTSLAAVATGLIKHGVAAQGVSLTMTGLAEQKFPVVAVVAPGHFVIVNSVSSKAISLWSPDSDGTGHGQTVAVTPIQWQQVWRGTALALNGIVGAGSAHTENTRNSASNGI